MKAKLKLTIYFNAIDKLPKLWKYRFYPLKKVLLLACNYLGTYYVVGTFIEFQKVSELTSRHMPICMQHVYK